MHKSKRNFRFVAAFFLINLNEGVYAQALSRLETRTAAFSVGKYGAEFVSKKPSCFVRVKKLSKSSLKPIKTSFSSVSNRVRAYVQYQYDEKIIISILQNENHVKKCCKTFLDK